MTINLVGDWPAGLAAAATAVAEQAKQHSSVELPNGDINLKLVDAAESQELNKRYSGNAYATDVLTFNYHHDAPEATTAADIAICLDVAKEQASEAKTELADEIALLVAHGLLHAGGHDHEGAQQRTAMEALQQQLVEGAGHSYRDFKWE